MPIQQLLTYLFVGLYSLTVLGIVLIIVSDNRNPVKTVSWIIILLLAPVVGLVGYFFFGQNLSKQRIIPRRMRKRLVTKLEAFNQEIPPHIPAKYNRLATLLTNTIHAVPLAGNRIVPYVDGKSKMEALLAEIAQARHHIHLQYYIFCDDVVGHRLREALIAKAREGVTVRILYDDVGSRGVKSEFFETMRREGIEVRAFLHVKFPRFTSKVNYRNHRKIVVIDGRVGFIGGMNIADRYLEGTSWGIWRDSHFRIEGNAVIGLQAVFLSDWAATTQQHVEGSTYFPTMAEQVGSTMQVVASGPFGKWRILLQSITMAIASARQRIWIQTPYYLPSEVLNTALQTAALAGVDVRLMLPKRSDTRVVDLATHSFLDDMVKAGVSVAFYEAGFLHAKQLIIDDDLTVVGSANFDFRSFEHNFEINAFIYDNAFTARMAAVFENDLLQCELLAPKTWFRRPRLTRFAESFMRIFAQLM